MALVGRRLFDFHDSTVNNGGSASGTDIYYLFDDTGAGVGKGTAYDPSTTLGIIPDIGDNHPEIGGSAIVTAVRRRPVGNGWFFEITYGSITGSTNRPPVDLLADDFITLERTTRPREVELPVFQLRNVEFPATDGGDPVEEKAWGVADIGNRFTLEEPVYTIVVAGEDSDFPTGVTLQEFIAANEIIDEQIGKLHELSPGKLFLFNGPQSIRQRTVASGDEPAKWEVRYEWVRQLGIANTIEAIGARNPDFPGLVFRDDRAYIAQDENFILRPYTNVYTANDPEDPGSEPIVIFTDLYETDETGWQGLPGIAP